MVTCSVVDCDVTHRNNPDNCSFHRFPVDTIAREKWLKLIGRQKWIPKKNSCICSKHFDTKYILERQARRILLKSALPTNFVSSVQHSNNQTKGQDYGKTSSSFVDEDISNCSTTTDSSLDARPKKSPKSATRLGTRLLSRHQSKSSVKKLAEDILEEQEDHFSDADYHCHECAGDIVGCRYVCVQCADLDMCAACEARGAHAHHYMLRVPADTPHHEATAILERIRQIVNIERQENHKVPIETEGFKTVIENDLLEAETTVKVEPQETGELEVTLQTDVHDTVFRDAEIVRVNAQIAESEKQ